MSRANTANTANAYSDSETETLIVVVLTVNRLACVHRNQFCTVCTVLYNCTVEAATGTHKRCVQCCSALRWGNKNMLLLADTEQCYTVARQEEIS